MGGEGGEGVLFENFLTQTELGTSAGLFIFLCKKAKLGQAY